MREFTEMACLMQTAPTKINAPPQEALDEAPELLSRITKNITKCGDVIHIKKWREREDIDSDYITVSLYALKTKP